MPPRPRSASAAVYRGSLGPDRASDSHRPVSAGGSAPAFAIVRRPKSGKKRKPRSKAGRRPVPGEETGQWRDDKSGVYGHGARLCSACGLYYNGKTEHRPPSLWRKTRLDGPSGASCSPSSTSLPVTTASSPSSGAFFSDSLVDSPVTVDTPLASPNTPYFAIAPLAQVRPRLKLTFGPIAADDLLPATSLARGSATLDEEVMSITLGSSRAAAKLDEDGAAETLLTLRQREVANIRDPEPSSGSQTPRAPPVSAPPFRLLDTRPAFLFNQPIARAWPLLPPSLLARVTYRDVSDKYRLAPMIGLSRTGSDQTLPSLRSLQLA